MTTLGQARRSPATEVAIARTREQVAELHAGLVRDGVITRAGGNVSARVPGADLFVITPSGSPVGEPGPDSVILCDLAGVVVQDTPGSSQRPSVDTSAHAHVYRELPTVGGIAHSHSPYATAWAAAARPIPCVLTAVAREFGGEIPVGPLAESGDESIGRGIVATLARHRSRAVLMRGHGPFSVGTDAADAAAAIVMVEDAARTVHLALQLGRPTELPGDLIDRAYRADPARPGLSPASPDTAVTQKGTP